MATASVVNIQLAILTMLALIGQLGAMLVLPMQNPEHSGGSGRIQPEVHIYGLPSPVRGAQIHSSVLFAEVQSAECHRPALAKRWPLVFPTAPTAPYIPSPHLKRL